MVAQPKDTPDHFPAAGEPHDEAGEEDEEFEATIVRPLPSGDLGERDVYGAQQHAPLMNYMFELNR